MHITHARDFLSLCLFVYHTQTHEEKIRYGLKVVPIMRRRVCHLRKYNQSGSSAMLMIDVDRRRRRRRRQRKDNMTEKRRQRRTATARTTRAAGSEACFARTEAAHLFCAAVEPN